MSIQRWNRCFRTVRRLGLTHPFFSDGDQVLGNLLKAEDRAIKREMALGDHWFYQEFYLVPELKAARFYAMDITERKHMEVELIRSNAELQQYA